MSIKKSSKIRMQAYLGYLGFLGFMGFSYFKDFNPAFLGYFAYFGFFAYFWIGKISNQIPDERYRENSIKAKAAVFNLALVEFVALNLVSLFRFVNKEILVLALSLCFASLLIAYAVKFYILEEK